MAFICYKILIRIINWSSEDKLNADLQQGIYKALESIAKLLTDHTGKLEFEINLINSQLIKRPVRMRLMRFSRK
jgi:hypothetical protein